MIYNENEKALILTLTPVSEVSTDAELIKFSITPPAWTSKFSFLLAQDGCSGPGPWGGTWLRAPWFWPSGCTQRPGEGLGIFGMSAGLPQTEDSFNAPEVFDPLGTVLHVAGDGQSWSCSEIIVTTQSSSTSLIDIPLYLPHQNWSTFLKPLTLAVG